MPSGRHLCSFFSRSSRSLTMAFNCGSDVPVQTTKKSVNDDRPRKSSTRISSAFFPPTMSAQVLASFSELMVFSSVKAVRFDDRPHGLGNEIADAPALRNALAHLRRGNIHPALQPRKIMRGRARVALEDDELDHAP